MRVVIFLLLVAVALSDDNKTVVSDDPTKNAPTNASFNSDGEFGVSEKGKWMALKWATLAEVNSNGQVVSYDLSKRHFGWSQAEVGDVLDDRKHPTGDRFRGVNFTEQLDNGAWFNVSVWIIDSNAVHSSAKRGSIKFSIYISNWTFASSNDSLVLTAGLVGFGGFVRKDDDHDDKTVTSSKGVYASGFLSAPAQALYDGVTTSSVTVEHTQKGEGKPVVIFTFGSFSTNVSYDPIFGSGASNLNPSFLVCLLLAFGSFIKQL